MTAPLKVKVETKNVDAIQKKLEESKVSVKKQILDAVSRTALAIQNEARLAAPVDTGRLRADIHALFPIKEKGMRAEIGTVTVNYGKMVEFGSKPHWPPPEPIENWVRHHRSSFGIGQGASGAKEIKAIAFLVSRAISKRGLPARPFLYPAFARNQRLMIAEIRKIKLLP